MQRKPVAASRFLGHTQVLGHTLALCLGLACLFGTTVQATAQGLIRDAEIERTLKKIALPLLKAAGVSPGSIDLLVVDDSTLNAFVLDGRTIFLHSGLIMRMNSVAMLQSVIGHELAHITSGHLVRRSLNLQSARSAIGVGFLLGLVAAATGNNKAAGGIFAGTAGSAMGKFLAHTRAEESTADRIGMQYMVRAGIDPQAAVNVLEIFRGQEALSVGHQDPYAQTHPLSDNRIRALKGQIAAYGGKAKPTPPALVYWHARMVAKFRGFRGNPSYILRKINRSDHSEIATLTRAIAYHRQGSAQKAVALMNPLIKKRPNDAFYYELKGQILLEGHQVRPAVNAYKKAVSLAPKESLILAGYGRALLSLKTASGNREALDVLRRARSRDPRDARMLRDLAVAYAKSRNNGMASLVTAERYALLARFKDAKTNALRAEGMLPRGSSGWLRSQDIIAAANRFLNR